MGFGDDLGGDLSEDSLEVGDRQLGVKFVAVLKNGRQAKRSNQRREPSGGVNLL